MHCVASAVEFSAGLGSSEAVVRGGRLELIRRSQRKEPFWSACSVYGRSKSADSFPATSSEHNAEKQVLKSTASFDMKPEMLKEAYDQCGRASAENNSNFYLGTLLMPPVTRKAIWAIMAWCRRTDELVDGPSASSITNSALDDWESRLEDLFAGHPHDMFDAALSDTVTKYQVDIQPFKDMIKGMRMDLEKSRYNNFDELYHYCYCVAGTVALMSIPVMGIAPESEATAESFHNSVLASGTANQLTNILRDVGEDARRGRIYLPQDELAQAGLSDEDIFNGKVTDKWRHFMKHQIARARMLFDEAEKGASYINQACRWPVYTALLLYKKILDEIEANDYDNFTKRASVSTVKKLMTLFTAYQRSLIGPSSGN